MTSVGTIINTHTGPARVVVMVPVGARPDGQNYSQALTQAVANGAVTAADAATTSPAALAQQNAAGNPTSPASSGPTAAMVTSQPVVQAVFVLDPHALSASPDSSGPQTDGQSSDGTSSGLNGSSTDPQNGKDGTRSADGSASDGTDKAGENGKSHWQPSGSARIAALYRTTEKTASDSAASVGDNLSILG